MVGGRLLRHTPPYNDLGWPAPAAPTAYVLVHLPGRPGHEPAVLAVGRRLGPSEDIVVAH